MKRIFAVSVFVSALVLGLSTPSSASACVGYRDTGPFTCVGEGCYGE
ncbi:MAG: hypothetical protein ACE14L_17790 [Terriglobales bacterium]